MLGLIKRHPAPRNPRTQAKAKHPRPAWTTRRKVPRCRRSSRIRSGRILIGFILSSAGLVTACTADAQKQVSIPLIATSSGLQAPIQASGGVTLQINKAQLAFGPLYLCAGYNAGDHCDLARLEWLDSIVLDLQRPNTVTLGQLDGVDGTVRSWMYDMGISSQLTDKNPVMLKAAKTLNGNSVVIEGTATHNNRSLPFVANIVVSQYEKTEFGIPVVRKRIDERFEHRVTGDEGALQLSFDPRLWLEGLDLSPYFADQSCAPDAPSILCQGSVQLQCSQDGQEMGRKDCAAQGMVCQSKRGCVSAIEFMTDSKTYRELLFSIITEHRAQFRWDLTAAPMPGPPARPALQATPLQQNQETSIPKKETQQNDSK